ncbi:unnamed protein product, partial [Rotaria sp. Silwood1]
MFKSVDDDDPVDVYYYYRDNRSRYLAIADDYDYDHNYYDRVFNGRYDDYDNYLARAGYIGNKTKLCFFKSRPDDRDY